MIQKDALLADLQQLLKELVDDLRERVQEKPELDARLLKQYQEAREAQRTAQAYGEWGEEPITQAAAAWILAAVFVRFLEDNGLVETPRLSGPGNRLRLARDHHTLYFQKHPSETDREYLAFVFRDVAQLPALRELFDEQHNPVWSIAPSGDGAKKILDVVQRINPTTGVLVHDFTDPEWNTRFLGDLYQDLSEAARKKYALLQTPEFVEEFILDRTLDPAINEFGYREVRLIDLTCGSGHFLLGAFRRLFGLWQRHEPATNTRELAQRALDGVYGVDLNPFAVAIARFRLLVAALRSCGITRLKDAPGFKIHLAAGDSLLHGPRFTAISGVQATLDPAEDSLRHVYATEDKEALRQILGQRYHAVVGNPPYITVKDKALNDAYRQRYGSCSGKYSLVVPFFERFFELALPSGEGQSAGYVGMITSNSFMKRDFGKKLIDKFIPRWNLTHVIDTSGAHVPGHGTPTVVLFGRNRLPVGDTVRAVMGIRGELITPEDPARGPVWSAIVAQVDRPGSQSDYVSVSDTARAGFHKHPWSIGGGGAAQLKELLDEGAEQRLGEQVESIGFAAITGEDQAFVFARATRPPTSAPLRQFGTGDIVRDWSINAAELVIWPYREAPGLAARPLAELGGFSELAWMLRTNLRNRLMFGKLPEESGLVWHEYRFLARDRFRTPLSIAFAFVATHNHFVLDRGGKVFNRTAPVIKLSKDATEDEHLALLGLLNSSTACFWGRQTLFDRGGGGIGGGLATETWERFLEHDGTKLQQFPLPHLRPLEGARGLDDAARQLGNLNPTAVAAEGAPTAERLADARQRWVAGLERMIALQEELDWECYRLYGLIDDELTLTRDQVPGLRLGERSFEIVMARRMTRGEPQTTWFERHGSVPITEIPKHWPEDYHRLVERRIKTIETKPNIRLIEQPEYKRRWNTEPWDTQQQRALRSWLCERLESPVCWPEVELQSCARLADRARADAEFIHVAELYRGRADFDVAALVAELVESETAPFLPVLRYSEAGLRKRALWERTWDLQRREDAIDASLPLPEDPVQKESVEKERVLRKAQEVGEIPVPPKYTSADFLTGDFWRLRGKLDVPKERFISYPGCERDADRSIVITWAGWDHLQQAQALAGYYVAMKEKEGWSVERLTPLLEGLLELLPWLEQWHNDVDPAFGIGMGEYFRRFVDEESRALDLTADAIRAWRPIMTIRKKRARG